ncbi:Uncharacterized protein DAT39_019552, partial [Clarias magur]
MESQNSPQKHAKETNCQSQVTITAETVNEGQDVCNTPESTESASPTDSMQGPTGTDCSDGAVSAAGIELSGTKDSPPGEAEGSAVVMEQAQGTSTQENINSKEQ